MSTWRPCSSCKKPLAHGALYWVCNVSTCNRKRTPFQFCSVRCWDAHVPVMNHRNAWCEERPAPSPPPRPSAGLPRADGSRPPGATTPEAARGPTHAEMREARLHARKARLARPHDAVIEKDILIVASRLKKYINERSGYNTSADVLEALSDIVRSESNRAIDNARADGRRTVKGRDFK